MSRDREINIVRNTTNARIEDVTEKTTIRALADKVGMMATLLRKREKEEAVRKKAAGASTDAQNNKKTAFPDKRPSPDYLAQNVRPVHISDDRNIVIFEDGYVYYRNETNEIVIELDECCKAFFDSPDFDRYLDPKKMTREELQMCTISAEVMQGLRWETAIMMVADRRCRFNNENGRKGDRNRTDNVVVSDEGEELSLFDIYCDRRTYRSIEDLVVDKVETERLHDVACAGVNKTAVKILERSIDDVPQELIASEVGMNVSTVKSTLCRERKKMRQNLLNDAVDSKPYKK